MSDPEARYQQTLEYLYGFVDFSLKHSVDIKPEQFDLGRMQALVAALENPQTRFKSIHVAGTKGKGSVSALCASALQAQGYRVGLYTSPHLDDYAERIQINGQLIPHAELVALVEALKPHIAAIPRLTTFEITTALAFTYFARQQCDAALIEVGLGGRLDATNVITPQVAVITSLSFDHMFLLGDTLAQIAGEKAGIIKPGVPVVLSLQAEEARLVVERVAREQGAPLTQVGVDYQFKPLAHSLAGQTFQIWPAPVAGSGLEPPKTLSIPLLGAHQVTNAATAYAALQVAAQNGLPVSDQAIQAGFAGVHWPGRFEVLRQSPPVVIDCAHNRDSALKLRQALDDYFPGYPLVMVFGASEDKDIEGMFAELMGRVRHLIAVKSFHPRAMQPEKLVALAEEYHCPAQIIPDVADGFEAALHLAGEEALVLVTGSIFVAAGARIAWEKKNRSQA
jgi:dihydrofolate synthase/folylpolyglutamate synthase